MKITKYQLDPTEPKIKTVGYLIDYLDFIFVFKKSGKGRDVN